MEETVVSVVESVRLHTEAAQRQRNPRGRDHLSEEAARYLTASGSRSSYAAFWSLPRFSATAFRTTL